MQLWVDEPNLILCRIPAPKRSLKTFDLAYEAALRLEANEARAGDYRLSASVAAPRRLVVKVLTEEARTNQPQNVMRAARTG
jgi:hypothetical protein